jgi:hypothetical protein
MPGVYEGTSFPRSGTLRLLLDTFSSVGLRLIVQSLLQELSISRETGGGGPAVASKLETYIKHFRTVKAYQEAVR